MTSHVHASQGGWIDSWVVDGHELIAPWGVECADARHFFSLTDGGFGNRIVINERNLTLDSVGVNFQNRWGESLWELQTQDDWKDGRTIYRRAELTALSPMPLLDFVVRFRFLKKYIDYAMIAGERIAHRNTNIYHQYQSSSVTLYGSIGAIMINVNDANYPNDRWAPWMYVRDYRDEWIVHARLLPRQHDQSVVKWYNTAIPQNVTNLLLRSDRIYQYLLYKSELRPSPKWNVLGRKVFRFACYPLGQLEVGERLRIQTSVRIL